MILNMETKRSLTALYVTVLVKNKYKQYEGVGERYKSHAEELDKLKIPWMLQNMTAGAADNPKNWERYNNSVIDEVIEKYNKIIENRRK